MLNMSAALRSRSIILLLLVLALMALAPLSHACDMCRDAVATNSGSGGVDGSGASAGLDFNSSIYFMLCGVFAVAGWIGWVMYKAIRGGSQAHQPRGFPVKSNVG